ncbi:hypothetical protein BX600DRAFT_465491 [Xylariales sp. PMI_506]|nr:hypothetical protein BX600DRAFT_465491 [Xylariales sp. PMI_506]
MERKGSTSSGITVQREVRVHRDEFPTREGSLKPPSVISIVRSLSEVRPRTPEEWPGALPPLRLDKFVRHPDLWEESIKDIANNKWKTEGIQDLVELLQQTPPPWNYMSIPDSFSISSIDDGRWRAKLKLFRSKRRKRIRRHRPPPVRLPDSAVVGTSLDGYRYLEISIPKQYSYLEPIQSLEDTGADSMEVDFERAVNARLGIDSKPRQVRNQNPGLGVSSTLQPVTEDGHSSMYDRSATSLSNPLPIIDGLSTPCGPRSSSLGSTSGPRTGPTQQEKLHQGGIPALLHSTDVESQNTTIFSHHPVVVLPPIKSATEEATRPDMRIGLSTPQRKVQLTDMMKPIPVDMPSIRLTPPERNSSKYRTPEVTEEPYYTAPQPQHAQLRSERRGEGIQGLPQSFTMESVNTLDSEPKVLDAHAAKAYPTIPILVRPTSSLYTETSMNPRISQPPPIQEVDSSPGQKASPTHAADKKSMSRKERVRERKQRDMRAMKAKTGHTSSDSPQSPQFLKPSPANLVPESPILGHFLDGSPAKRLETRVKQISTPLPAVAESEPSTSPELSPAIPDRTNRASVNSILSSGSSLVPASPASFDRTSYYRRKERQAAREAQRAREARFVTEAANEQGRGQRKQEEELIEAPPPSRLLKHDLASHYDDILEERLQGLEERLYRVERNREIFLREIVPRLESLNRLFQEQYHYQRELNKSLVDPELSTLRLRQKQQQQKEQSGRSESLKSSRDQTGRDVSPRRHTMTSGETRGKRRQAQRFHHHHHFAEQSSRSNTLQAAAAFLRPTSDLSGVGPEEKKSGSATTPDPRALEQRIGTLDARTLALAGGIDGSLPHHHLRGEDEDEASSDATAAASSNRTSSTSLETLNVAREGGKTQSGISVTEKWAGTSESDSLRELDKRLL